jgi:hypothetical protein
VGNFTFKQLFNEHVPDAYRVVVDGDIVTGVPRGGYSHVGTEVLIDDIGSGSIIVDPSFVERRMRIQSRSHISVHSLLVYRRGLQGVLDAAAYLSAYLESTDEMVVQEELIDPVRLAIQAKKRQNTILSLEEEEAIYEAIPSDSRSISKDSMHGDTIRNLSRSSIDESLHQNAGDLGMPGLDIPLNVRMDDETRQFDKEYTEHSFFLTELKLTQVLRPNVYERLQNLLRPIRSALGSIDASAGAGAGAGAGGRGVDDPTLGSSQTPIPLSFTQAHGNPLQSRQVSTNPILRHSIGEETKVGEIMMI